MKWLQYLVDRTGKNNLPDTLGYYVDIGWISEDVRLDLINYSKGITEEPAQTGTHPPFLPTKDHLQSLLFIQKLKGIQLDDRFLIKIERDMEKIVKSLEGYPLK
jgi:flagellar protein FlaD